MLNIYLDESGDTGWRFDQPYQKGGSSRYLVITACAVLAEENHYPERLLRQLYQHFGWNTHHEKKWTNMALKARTDFTSRATRLLEKHRNIKVYFIVVTKKNVRDHIRQDPNKRYNYMVKLLLLNVMKEYERVCLIPDKRSIKVGSGNSLHDYLQTELWFTAKAKTILQTLPSDSHSALNLQFVDMLSGAIYSHFELSQDSFWNMLQPHITQQQKLFFNCVDTHECILNIG